MASISNKGALKSFFIGAVNTRWLTLSREMQLLNDFSFIDKNGHQWLAEKGSIIDGASIPRVVWSLVGSPFSGKYRRASVIHDVYCKTKTRPHKKVHKMFYEAMIADGVPKIKAKMMYRAVCIGGPSWKTKAKTEQKSVFKKTALALAIVENE